MNKNLTTSVATVVMVIALIAFAALAPGPFESLLTTIQTRVIGEFGFIFTYPAFFASLLFVGIALTPLGRLRFGEESPEFSTLAWLGMLFATGMGIGLVTWGVLEPRYHVEAGLSRDQALLYAFNHWGLLAWAGYLAIGVIFALVSAFLIRLRQYRSQPSTADGVAVNPLACHHQSEFRTTRRLP